MTHGLGGSSVPLLLPSSSFSPFNSSFSPSAAWIALNWALCFALIKDRPLFYTAQSPYLVNRALYFVTARLRCASSQALVTKGDQDSNRLFLYLLRFRFHFYSSPFVYFFLFTMVYTKNLTGSFNTSRASSTFSKSKCMAVIGVATAPLNKLAERY